MNLSRFPGYTEFDPLVPVWCVTPNRKGCIHRFFDTNPISPSGRYLAVFQFPFEDRRPEPGETGHIVLVDLESGEDRVMAETCGWEPQMGANVNWGGSDTELYFNDVDTDTWQPFAWKLNPFTGERQRMQGTVYHASPDGRWLISANMTTMRKSQPGYGVSIPLGRMRRNLWQNCNEDGFYLTDTRTGKVKMLASIRELLERANPPVKIEEVEQQEIYGFHSKFNPQGDRLMLSLRWFEAKAEARWDMFKHHHNEVRFAWVTCDLNGENVHCAVGPEEWIKRGHHATWFPDGKQISMNLDLNREKMLRLVSVNQDGSDLKLMSDALPGSGHPTVHPNGKNVLTDTYKFEASALGDGTIPLRWIDLKKGTEECLVRVNVNQPYEDRVLRVDAHPAWDAAHRYVIFNGFVGGTRRVFIADLESRI